jgi:hypothetical protein
MWTSRKKASRIVTLKTGATFTITVTPQISNDLKSVSRYLSRN